MSNAAIIARIQLTLDAYEGGEICPTDVETIVEASMNALEAVPYQCIVHARHLCYRLVTSDFTMGEEQFIDCESVTGVMHEFRRFLSTLPGANHA